MNLWPNMRLGCRLALALLASGPLACFASLAWENPRVELTAGPDDLQAVGVFRFTNRESKPMTITVIRPTCGCTTADLPKRTYAPGESGELRSIFTFGGAVGTVEKTILVGTDDPQDKPATLVLRVTIPEVFVFSTRLLQWRKDETPAEKSLTLRSLRRIAAVTVAPVPDAAVASVVEPVKPGEEYRLRLRPKSANALATIPVNLQVRFADGKSREAAVFVLVR